MPAEEGGSAPLNDEEFLAAFEEARLSPASFHHRDHIRAAWLCVRRYQRLDAIARFSSALRRFAIKAGAPTLYNETITWAYLLLIADRVRRGAAEEWEAFAAENDDLLTWRPSILDRYYRAETLRSDAAKQHFVWPDALD